MGGRMKVTGHTFPWMDIRTIIAIWTNSILGARADFP
jgi:hypothetical protein